LCLSPALGCRRGVHRRVHSAEGGLGRFLGRKRRGQHAADQSQDQGHNRATVRLLRHLPSPSYLFPVEVIEDTKCSFITRPLFDLQPKVLAIPIRS
jgi:hypothetical protein